MNLTQHITEKSLRTGNPELIKSYKILASKPSLDLFLRAFSETIRGYQEFSYSGGTQSAASIILRPGGWFGRGCHTREPRSGGYSMLGLDLYDMSESSTRHIAEKTVMRPAPPQPYWL